MMIRTRIIAYSSALILCCGFLADFTSPARGDTASWPFSLPGGYVVSDSTKIEIAGGVARLIPVDQTDDDSSASGFGGGAHNQTQWDGANGWLELVGGASSGQFTSRVMDAGASASWDSIYWSPQRPCLKELPSLKRIESAYAAGNADMTGNVFLAHFNESPIAHGSTAYDSSGEFNNGTLYTGEGAADKSVSGKLSGAVAFDGVDDYVDVPDASSLDMVEAMTLEAWIEATGPGGAVGEITYGQIDSLEFNVTHGRDPDIVHVAGDIYAIAYDRRGLDNDGWLCTVSVSSGGTIGAACVDSLEFDPQKGNYPDILHISGDVYAIAYNGPGADGWLKTVQIAPDGTIGNAAIDSLEFDPLRGQQPCMVHISGDVYAIAYSGYGADGWLVTVQIAADGTIGGSTLDSLEFDPTRGAAPKLAHVSGDVYAIAYSGPGSDGWLATVQIAADGTIGAAIIDSLEFDTVNCVNPDLVHVAGSVYAVAYTGPGYDGWIVTVQIAGGGTIGPGTLDSAEFNPVNALAPDLFHISRNVYAIAYGGPANEGWMLTGDIADDGTIGSMTDRLKFDPARGTEPCIAHIAGDVYAIAHCGSGYDGYIRTLGLLTERGIVKAGSYGIDSDTASAFAWVNGEIVSAAVSSGWNHIALVYDRNAALNQEKLYVNGSLAASNTFTDSVAVGSSPLLIGKRLAGGIDEAAIFSRALSPAEIADHYKRGALRLRYQVRSGSSNPPPGAFLGPDGTTGTYYSELLNRGTGFPSLLLTSVAAGRYFQYRAYLDTDDTSYSPELDSLTIGPAHYPGDDPTVRNAAGQAFVSLASFAETLGPGNAGSLRYQISNDGVGWYYWNGSSWSAATGYAQTNTAAEINANCSTFDNDVGAGDFYFKAFLHSGSASQRVELDQLDLSFVAVIISVTVDNSTFSFGTRTLNTWLFPDSSVVVNDGTVAEDFLGRISQFSEGINTWGVSDVANGNDIIRAQWSTGGPGGPWFDISAYDSSFTVKTNIASTDSVTLWFRIMTPTSTSSFNEYSSTFTVIAQKY